MREAAQSGEPLLVHSHQHNKEVVPHVQVELPVRQFLPAASSPDILFLVWQLGWCKTWGVNRSFCAQ